LEILDGGGGLQGHLSGWKQKIVGFAGALGAPGLFLISFLDSSILTFPVINDLLLIDLSIQHPGRMPLYAGMAALGSVLGCVVLYFIARKGGEAFFKKKAGARGEVIRHWVERNGFGGMLVAALLPPPTPFKIFVFAAGVFEVPVWSFTSAVILARVFRYFGMGYLAVRFGEQAMPYLAAHKWETALAVVGLVAVSYGLSRLLLRSKPQT
jgi:membrane protein YqaA with SNARE-associated domain